MATEIHPTAVIHDGAELGVDVQIGPYTVVGPGARVGDRTRVGPQVVIDGVTQIGEENVIVGQANLGGPPQDLSYRGEQTRLQVGDRNVVREFVTINRGTVKGGGTTYVGSDCLLMACSHVAHDCEIGSNVILGNNVMLAGHVKVCDRANISGGAAAHHFTTIGSHAYVGGMTRMIQDVPPFMILEGHPSRVRGVNVIGLQRAGFDPEVITELRNAYKRIYRSTLPRKHILEELKAGPNASKQLLSLVESLENTERGIKGRHREALREDFKKLGAEIFGVNEEAQ